MYLLITLQENFDQNNQLIGLNYSGKEYVYARNLLGEIYDIMDLKGKSIIRYTYNAYGVPSITLGTNLSSSETLIASDIAELNIYLYKGYIYDQETKLYYCKSRYYDPEVGRWLSVDHIAYLDVESIGGLNLYAYCGNNPVMYLDPSGNMPQWLKWTIGFGIILGLGIAALTIGGAVIIGASIGAIVGGSVGIIGGISFDENGFHFDSDKASTGFMFGTITGAVSGALGAKIGGISKIGTFAQRSIMAGIDGSLSLGAYLGQAGPHGEQISLGGVLISIGSGLFSFAEPTGYKVFDAICGPIMGAEIAWVYDVFNKFYKNQNVSTVRLTPYF